MTDWRENWVSPQNEEWIAYAEDYSELGRFLSKDEALAEVQRYADYLTATSDHP